MLINLLCCLFQLIASEILAQMAFSLVQYRVVDVPLVQEKVPTQRPKIIIVRERLWNECSDLFDVLELRH